MNGDFYMDDFLILVAILIGLFIIYIIADEFGNIAYEKGYGNSKYNKYFCYSFFLGIIGYMMVVALPPKAEVVEEKSETESYLSNCAGIFTSQNGSNISEKSSTWAYKNSTKTNVWICKKCKRENQIYTMTCACGETKNK